MELFVILLFLFCLAGIVYLDHKEAKALEKNKEFSESSPR